METLTFDLQRFAIYNYDDDKLVNGTSGADFIRNLIARNVTINAGSGNDTVDNSSNRVIINGDSGNDSISNTSAYVTINGGSGNDKILHAGSWAKINAGSGDDIVSLTTYFYNSDVTVNGGSGNDTIYGRTESGSVLYQYTNGDGNDVIYNLSATDTLSITGDSYTSVTSGNDVVLTVGTGKITLKGAKSKTLNIKGTYGSSTVSTSGKYAANYNANSLISGTSGNDSLYNYGSNVTLNGGAGNDNLVSFDDGSKVTFTGGAGNDTILNWSKNSKIDGGDGNDHFFAAASYSTVIGGAGNDSVENYATNVSISGGAGNDTIKNTSIGNYSTINGGAGNDIISLSTSSKNNVIQYATGDGNDTVYNIGTTDKITISGSYTRSTVGNDVVLSVGSGSIKLVGAKGKTLNIASSTPNTTLTPTPTPIPIPTLSSSVNNYTKNKLITGTAGKDTINNYAGGVTVRGQGGNDYIYNSTSSDYTINNGYGYVTLEGGDGNDTIMSYDPRVSINGGAGADLISLRSSDLSNITINAGTGNDTIYGNANNYGVLYQYKSGDGNDIIYNLAANDTISISGSNYTSVTSGNDVILTLGNDKVTLKGAKGISPVIYASGSPVTYNYTKKKLVSGTANADTVYNYAGGTTVRGNGGNDYIYNSTSSDYTINNDYGYVTLEGGDGNDTVMSYDPRVSINGGAGADLISLKSWNSTGVTINAGTGNDTVYSDSLGGVLYQYKSGDGNDIVYNLAANDSISITGSSYTSVTSGSDVVLTVGSGKITLKGAKGKSFKIYSPTPTPTPTPTVSSGVTPQDVIKKFMGSLDKTSNSGIAALDEAVSVASGGHFRDISSAIRSMVADCRNTNNATKFLKDYCGIDLSNSDTGAITGSDAGTSTVKTAKSIVPEDTSLDYSSFEDNFFKINGLTVQLAKFDIVRYEDGSANITPYEIEFKDLPDAKQKYIWQAAKTWWIPNALTLIASSYDNRFGFTNQSSATVKKLYFGFENYDGDDLATTWTTSANTDATRLQMTVNMKYYNGIDTVSVDGETSVRGAGYLDRTLAHEFTHAVMSANIYSVANLPQFIKEGMAELTHGIDDERGDVITKLAGKPADLENSLSLYNNRSGESNAYAGGYMFLRYLAKKGSENYGSSSGNMEGSGKVSGSSNASSSSVSVKGANLTVTKDFSADRINLTKYSGVKTVNLSALSKGVMIVGNKNPNSISAGKGADSIFANVGDDTILGGAGNDILYGEAGNDVIKGDAGNDSINGGTGNDTLMGGDGNDIFIFGEEFGKDIITDYTPGQDKIKLLEGKISSSSVSGSDIILTGSKTGSITVKGGKDKNITVIDGNGKETTKKYTTTSSTTSPTTATTSTLNDKSPAAVTLGSSYKNANASTRTKAIKITGNTQNNSILGGKAADTLWGATGNDTLTGGNGNDTFIYSAGKDVITDYASGDKISLGAAVSKTSLSGSDVVFTIGSGSLTVKNGKGKSLAMIDKSGKAYATVVGAAGSTSTLKTVTNTDKSPVAIGAAVKTVNASSRTTAVKITGNALDNVILGGSKNDSLYGGTGNDSVLGNAGNDKLYGEAGNDTLRGGAGNDSLWGGVGNDSLFGDAGNDTFIYGSGDGKDTIIGFETGDLLSITGTFSGTYNSSKKEIYLKVGSTTNALTLKDFTATSFNINGDAYRISGSKLVKK